jgi:hypothetical protein
MEPDGWLELQCDTDFNGLQILTIEFSDMRYWKMTAFGVQIDYKDESTTKHSRRVIFPWHTVGKVSVYCNSEEYTEWFRENHRSANSITYIPPHKLDSTTYMRSSVDEY